MKIYGLTLFLAVLLSLAPAAQAQHEMFTVNPDASEVTFLLGGSGHHVHGTFHLQSGLIDFDPAAKTISGLVIVWAASGDSGNKSRDRNMHDNVLESEQFPLVTFAPKTCEGKLALSGIFTLLDTPCGCIGNRKWRF